MISRAVLYCLLVVPGSLLVVLSACSSGGDGPAVDQGVAGDRGAVDVSAVDVLAVDVGGPGPDQGGGPLPDQGQPPPADAAPDLPPCTLAGVYSSSDATCNACAEARCCAELNACFTAPACNDDYVLCTLVCATPPEPDGGVADCLARCAVDHPAGKALYDVAIGCAETRCAIECA